MKRFCCLPFTNHYVWNPVVISPTLPKPAWGHQWSPSCQTKEQFSPHLTEPTSRHGQSLSLLFPEMPSPLISWTTCFSPQRRLLSTYSLLGSPLFHFSVDPQGSGLGSLSSLQSLFRCQDLGSTWHFYPKDSAIYISISDRSPKFLYVQWTPPNQHVQNRTLNFPPFKCPSSQQASWLNMVFQAKNFDVFFDSNIPYPTYQ